MRRRMFATSLLCIAVAAGHLGAQSLKLRVVRSIDRIAIEGADVSAPGGDFDAATTDSSGTVTLNDLTAGWLVLTVRKIGYEPRVDTVNVLARGVTTREVSLRRQAALDTLRTVAAHTYRSPNLRAFEDRRQAAAAGYFITEDELRKLDGKSLAAIVAQRTPGLMVLSTGGNTYLASTRRDCSGPVLQGCNKNTKCYVTTYVDGMMIYQAGTASASEPLDFNRYPVMDYAAVEFYPSAAMAPVQFNATGMGGACGVLLLWTRER